MTAPTLTNPLAHGASLQFALGPTAVAVINNATVYKDGVSQVVTTATTFGPYSSSGPNSGGALMRAIGDATGNGLCVISDNAESNSVTLSRDSAGNPDGLIDSATGEAIAFAAIQGAVTQDDLDAALATKADASALAAKADATAVTSQITSAVSGLASQTFVQTAVSSAVSGLGSANTSPTRIADSNTVAMNVTGAGNAMPVTVGRILVSTARTLTPGATAEGGSNTAVYALAAALTLSGFDAVVCPSSIYSNGVIAAGNVVWIVFLVNQGIKTAIVNQVGTISSTPPTFGTPVMTANAITIPITPADADNITGTMANVHLTGANGTTKTVTGIAVINNSLAISFTPTAAYGDVVYVGFDAGFLTDPVNGLTSAALGATLVTDNIALPVPNAPTVVAGTNTTTSISGTITAPSTGPVPTSYTLFYKLHSASTFTTGPTVAYAGASTPFTISGLPSGTTAVSYDVGAIATDATGPSASSAAMTSSLVAAAPSSIPTTVAATGYPANPYDVTAAAFNDWYAIRSGQLAFSYRKAGANLITVAAGSNLASVSGQGGAPTISWDGTDGVDNDGPVSAGNSGGNSVSFNVTNSALAADLDISVPAPNGVECELWLAGYCGDPSTVATAIGQLSESGANVSSLSVGGAVGFWYARFLFEASTANATFNAILRQGANSPNALCFGQVLYKTGVSS